jgi:hypothetical protein
VFFCDGCREFIETRLGALAQRNPQVLFEVAGTPNRHPHVVFEYACGAQIAAAARNAPPREITATFVRFRDRSGAPPVNIKKGRVIKANPALDQLATQVSR